MAPGLLLAWQLAQRQVPEPPPPADDLQWTAPPDCPDRDALLAGVATRRGRALAPGQAHFVAHTTRVAPHRYRLDLRLQVGDRHETRVWTARTCAALVDAAALLIALAVDADTSAAPQDAALAAPEPALAEPEPPAQPAEPALAEPEPPPLFPAEPDDPAPRTPVPAPRRGPGGFLRLHALGEIGALPGPTGGLGLAGGVLWRRFRLELLASYLASRTVSRPPAGLRALLVAGAVLGCARPGRGALELPLCAGLELGGMPATAAGPGARATTPGRWLAGVLGVGVVWRVHARVGVFAALQGLAAAQRTIFVVRDPGPEREVFDPGVVSGRLALGIELRLGDPR